MMRHVCLLCRSNYVGFDVLTIYEICSIYDILGCFDKIMDHLSSRNTSLERNGSLEILEKAEWALLYQRVYDPKKKQMVHLSKLPEKPPKYIHDANMDFLGPSMSCEDVIAIAEGVVNPLTMRPFEDGGTMQNVDITEAFIKKKDEFFTDEELANPIAEFNFSEQYSRDSDNDEYEVQRWEYELMLGKRDKHEAQWAMPHCQIIYRVSRDISLQEDGIVEGLEKAETSFYQGAYDSKKKQKVRQLSEFSDSAKYIDGANMDFLDPSLSCEDAVAIIEGVVNPVSMNPFEGQDKKENKGTMENADR